ncbi:carbohydrate ABC transporter permease [Candidatus Caldatribacterium saccharofermentans]|uniref:carbohydrate ABC transporter permease n=1 Tax=Candidatus Caldatribacterium saccharofermentans TaxID=1454753 RepID=UPI003D077769
MVLRKRTLWILLMPLFAFLSLTFFYPMLYQFLLSFEEHTLYTAEPFFVGLRNYAIVLQDPLFFVALRNALVWTALSVVFQIVLGLFAALLLNIPRRGYRVFRNLSLIPFVLPPVAIAVTWKWLYNPLYGLINYFVTLLGGEPVNFLGRNLALYSVSWVNIWKAFPFYALFILAGLQSIPQEIHEAARIDGATSFAIFRYITLPLIRPLLFVMALFATVWTFNYFDLIYSMTQGGPGHTTEILATLAYKTVFLKLRFDHAATLGVFMFLINFALSLAILTISRRVES